MSGKWTSDKKKIEWLFNHSELWEDSVDLHFDATCEKMFKYMKRARLYSGDTSIDSVSLSKLGRLLKIAKKQLDDENQLF